MLELLFSLVSGVLALIFYLLPIVVVLIILSLIISYFTDNKP